MSDKSQIGVLVNRPGDFDEFMTGYIKRYILNSAMFMITCGRQVDRTSLASELGMSRNRVTRITKLLGITHIFKDGKSA
jgi:hypothetical protein